MLNKVKKNIIPMLDTLGDALTQYLASPEEELRNGIAGFIDAVNAPLSDEGKAALELSVQLKSSLETPILSEVEKLYNEYCTEIENIPVQYKVVFLPYYDNTWDSLASVYEVFAADPMFVAEIVIIPIRRNTPTGWKMVYEDYLTPQGIPNTPFTQYSFERDLPDFVFYNNPYDGVNIEKFHFRNIKPYAGCMVYVPYALYRRMLHTKEKLEEETEIAAHLPGHDYADIFIVQGKSFLKNFAHRSRNGKKMVALGNPKLDNIYHHMQNYPRYPEWDKATGGKTVFMLNTHYLSAIKGSYKACLLYLIEIIEQNDDLALIWRPHPQSFLMFDENDGSESHIEWQAYINRVNNHERMILDRTASDISAIMYSDAIVSHDSSVVAESIFADKPVFLLAFYYKEMLPEDVWANIPVDDYMKKLKQARKYDPKNIFLFSAVQYLRLDSVLTLPKNEITAENCTETSLSDFIDDIRNGVDSKKEVRGLFREQLFINRDGTCGKKIHDYIVNLINT